MKKIFSYIIIFVLLVTVGTVNVKAKSFDCECYAGDYEFTFHFDEDNLYQVPKFVIKEGFISLKEDGLDGNENFQSRIQNYNRVYGSNNDYTYIDEYVNKGTCPTYILIAKDGIKPLENERHGKHYHVYAADDESKEAIKDNFDDDYDRTGPFGGDYPVEIFEGTCKMTGLKTDPDVSNSNEPSNEPTDPYSNIPNVKSNEVIKDNGVTYYCGGTKKDNAVMKNISSDIPRITRFLYIFLQILVPIGLVLVSSIDLFKSIAAQKEDEIKKGQQTLIKRIVTAIIVFFVFAIVKLVLSVISDNSDSIIDCISCFLENSSEYCKR